MDTCQTEELTYELCKQMTYVNNWPIFTCDGQQLTYIINWLMLTIDLYKHLTLNMWPILTADSC